MAKKVKFNWAVFNIETGFRLTEYTTRTLANDARGYILYDQPDLRNKIGIRQKGYSNEKGKSKTN